MRGWPYQLPEPLEPVAVRALGPAARRLARGERFSVLCWNVQFGGSRRHVFFYDGGEIVRPPPEDVRAAVAGIREVIAELSPDVALLQEVDRASDRTGRVDQLRSWRDAAPFAFAASTPYHRAAWVPYPPRRQLGRVDMHLVTLSRLELAAAERVALPPLDEPALRRLFNLRRAILGVELPLEGGGVLRLGNTHFSAFSRGDGTLGRQVAVAAAWLDRGGAALLGGDLNLLPPGDDPSRLPQPGWYAEQVNPLAELLSRYPDVSGEGVSRARWRTWLPHGASAPDRRLDYLLLGGGLDVVEARVLREHSEWSDHLPLLAVLEVAGTA